MGTMDTLWVYEYQLWVQMIRCGCMSYSCGYNGYVVGISVPVVGTIDTLWVYEYQLWVQMIRCGCMSYSCGYNGYVVGI